MQKWSPLLAVSLGTFMLLVDVTIVTVALPAISHDLGSTLAGLQWVLDGYALALAALVLGIGAAADRLGRRRTYLAGLVLFALASLGCALARNEQQLIVFRLVQGIGGAGMLATTVALLSVAYRGRDSARDRAIAFGIWGAVNGAAAAAGPIAGGLLTEHLDWRWIFLVNLPVSVLALAFTVFGVKESAGGTGRLDLPGTLTFTVAMTAVVYGLIKAGDKGWTDGVTLGAFGVGAVSLIAFVVVEKRREHPLLDLKLLRNKSFSTLLAAAVLLQAAAFAYLPFTTIWLQDLRGEGPVQAGVLGALPMSVAAFVVAGAAGRLLHRLAPQWSIGIGLVLIGIGDFLQAVVKADSPTTVFLAGLALSGVGVGMSLPVLSSAALATVPVQRSGMAGGALNAFRQFGFALGVAVFGAVLTSAPDTTTARPVAFVDGLRGMLILAGILALVAGVAVAALVRGRAPHHETSEQDQQPVAAGSTAG
jgi:EmrB/QacA subfamily drug resistance transporter